MLKEDFHTIDLEKLEHALETDQVNGISDAEAAARIKKYGPNILKSEGEDTWLTLLWNQIKSPLVFILILAGVATLFFKEYSESVVIFLAVLINVSIGLVQEGRAGKAFKALAESQKRFATVIRGGIKRVIDASLLVPGDLVIVESGNYIPADMRLLTSDNLMVNEAALTGEWKAVAKNCQCSVLNEDDPEVENENLVFMGTVVTYGLAKAFVISTGSETEIGEIAKGVTFVSEQTPLQESIKRLSKLLLIVIFVVLTIYQIRF